MKTIRKLVCMAVMLGLAGTMLFAQETKPLFKMQKIDDKRYESCGVGDFNNDGHPDIVAGEYIYFGPDFTKKVRIREIQSDINENGDGYAWDFMDMPMDVDGDGLLDIVTLSWHGQSIEWLKNPGLDKLDSFWEISLVEKNGNFEMGDLWDIRGNGKNEGLLPNSLITTLYTVGKKEDGTTGLIRTLICDKQMQFGVGCGDVNGDGRPDIIRPNAWFEAPEDILTGQWIEHPLSLGGKDGKADHTPQILVHDVNKDGRNDIITSSAHGYGIFWYEQLEGKDQWVQHTIDDTWTQAHALCLADIDGCGELELIAGKRFRAHNGGDPEEDKPQCIYYYKHAVNADGNVAWTRYTISYNEGVGSSMAIYAVDLTGNGTLDLVMTSKSGGPVVFFNQTEKIKVLIIDGQNNHNWKGTTPVLKDIYEKSGRFTVDVATTPSAGQDMSGFKPDFSKYDVVTMNYNGDRWPKETDDAFEKFVREGGGLVIFHAADNAFRAWKEFNEMIAVGGWEGRNESDGPYLYVKDGEIIRDMTPGGGGSHGPQVEFRVETFTPEHPIMKGLPTSFLHTADELYCKMRGPAKNVTILATALSKTNEGGSGHEEPVLLTVDYGKGRVFHTMLGHDGTQCKCVGFQTTLLRGTEWAATDKVTIACPGDFPTADKTRVRP